MATQITREGGDLKIRQTATNIDYIPLDDVSVEVVNGKLTVSDQKIPRFTTKNSANVSTPSEATLELLADAIVAIARAGDGVNPNDILTGDTKSVVITAVSGEIVPANPDRHTVILTNDNTKSVWLAIDKPAVKDEGMLLLTQGDRLEFPASKFGTGAINGIKTAGGNADIIYQEFTT